MLRIDNFLTPAKLAAKLETFWRLSGEKIVHIEKKYDASKGSPVFTVDGKYTTRGWTEWTRGFQYGSAILQYEATGEKRFLDIGREKTISQMATHVSHIGVHDHGFNNVSTYGNLLRLMNDGKLPFDENEKNFYELALKISGAVQASRWTPLPSGGFIHSFNGPHSLFVDTIRSCRALVVSHLLGHALFAENDSRINLLHRAIQHIKATADYSVYYGDNRDTFDISGRTAHESIFNTKDGCYRCPNSQQGYSGFTTWTRGLAWAMLGFAEELEVLSTSDESEFVAVGGKANVETFMVRAATATCDFFIENAPTDGIPYWDTGAPNLDKIGDYLSQPSNPYNGFEPIDSSAAAIGAQGLLRLGHHLSKTDPEQSNRYWQAGLTVLDSLFDAPYLSADENHQGLILHSIYHRPNGWDYIPAGSTSPNGESSMWGDYHAREAATYLSSVLNEQKYYTFAGCVV
jgi:unsaturated chondroitin disaccharide hydrolase